MERNEVHTLLMEKIQTCFSPTAEEIKIIEDRFSLYDDTQLIHLERNFEVFGVNAVVECLYGLKFNEV